MKLGMQVGLGLGHIVLDGDCSSPSPQRGPQFSSHICCGKMAGWIKMPLGTEVGFGPGDFVLDVDPAPFPKKGAEPPILGTCLLWPNTWMDQDGTWHGVGPRPRPHYAGWGPSSHPKKGTEPPNFRPTSIVAKRLYQDTTWYGGRPQPTPHCVR